MKPIIEFHRAGSDEPELFACGKCGVIFTDKTWARDNKTPRQMAEGCCAPGVCEDCGRDDLRTHFYRCDGCADQARFDKAEKVLAKDWNGPVEYNDTFYETLGEFYEDHFDDDEADRPDWVYACAVRKGVTCDPVDIIENMTEDTYDGFELVDEEGLRKFLEEWNAKQDQVWWESTSTVVLIDWSEVQ